MTTAVENLSVHLKKQGLRLTVERRKLLDLVFSIEGHFSPEDLLERVQKQRLSVSRATIYRVLPVLIEAGLIQQSLLSEGQTRFEVTFNKAHHDHLVCSNCNKVIEFQHRTIEILQHEIANQYGFKLEHHVMELVGRCRDCQSL